MSDLCEPVSRALAAYGLTDPDVSILRVGVYCAVFRVDADRAYVARLRAPEATEADVRFARLWTKAVGKVVPVAHHLCCEGDTPRVEGRLLDLVEYIPQDDSEDQATPDDWVTVGEWVGKMHHAGDAVSGEAPVDLDYGNHPNRRLLSRYLAQAEVDVPRSQRALMRRVRHLYEKSEAALEGIWDGCRTGVVHGDMHFWNVLYSGGRPVGIIDFDFLQRGILAYDLAYADIWLDAWERERPAWRGVRQRYRDAYGMGREEPLRETEAAALPWLRIRIHLMFWLDQVRISWNRAEKRMEDYENAERIFRKVS